MHRTKLTTSNPKNNISNMEATKLLTPISDQQVKLLKALENTGMELEMLERDEHISNHNSGELYLAFQGYWMYAQLGERYLLTKKYSEMHKFLQEINAI